MSDKTFLENFSGVSNTELNIEVIKGLNNCSCPGRYDITGFDTAINPASIDEHGYQTSFSRLPIVFQTGNPKEVGYCNGITVESLLAICCDRLANIQKGPEESEENKIALIHLNAAIKVLRDGSNLKTEET